MLKIRLQRIGRKNDPSFRVVVTEHTRGPKSEKHVDRVGFYNPKTKEQKLDAERITHWIANGAQPSGTVHNMLLKAGIIKGKTINVLPQKSPVVKDPEGTDESKDSTSDGAGEEGAAPLETGTNSSEDSNGEDAPVAEEGGEVSEETTEAPAEEEKTEKKEETPAEEAVEEKKEEPASAEKAGGEAPVGEEKTEKEV
ncbi:MAG: 30S ribosomal protein S16 [Candidatus Pacebacteria bacterium]|nr:30S ribosomal protein S16 [Candidatus Paceibacterota bacterium]